MQQCNFYLCIDVLCCQILFLSSQKRVWGCCVILFAVIELKYVNYLHPGLRGSPSWHQTGNVFTCKLLVEIWCIHSNKTCRLSFLSQQRERNSSYWHILAIIDLNFPDINRENWTYKTNNIADMNHRFIEYIRDCYLYWVHGGFGLERIILRGTWYNSILRGTCLTSLKAIHLASVDLYFGKFGQS